MPQDTGIALFLMGELVAVLRANDPDAFKYWLSGGVQDLGESVVVELLLDASQDLSAVVLAEPSVVNMCLGVQQCVALLPA